MSKFTHVELMMLFSKNVEPFSRLAIMFEQRCCMPWKDIIAINTFIYRMESRFGVNGGRFRDEMNGSAVVQRKLVLRFSVERCQTNSNNVTMVTYYTISWHLLCLI